LFRSGREVCVRARGGSESSHRHHARVHRMEPLDTALRRGRLGDCRLRARSTLRTTTPSRHRLSSTWSARPHRASQCCWPRSLSAMEPRSTVGFLHGAYRLLAEHVLAAALRPADLPARVGLPRVVDPAQGPALKSHRQLGHDRLGQRHHGLPGAGHHRVRPAVLELGRCRPNGNRSACPDRG
jgi:hypothetical protein